MAFRIAASGALGPAQLPSWAASSRASQVLGGALSQPSSQRGWQMGGGLGMVGGRGFCIFEGKRNPRSNSVKLRTLSLFP